MARADGRSGRRLLDLAGLGLVAALASWISLAGAVSGGDPAPLLELLLVVTVTVVAARWLSLLHRWVVPALLAAGAGAFALANLGTLLARQAANPLGYSNAIGALYLLAAAAALLVLARSARTAVRSVAAVAAVAFAMVPWLNGTDTAAVLSPLLLLAFVARRPQTVRRVVLAAAALPVAALLATAWLGWTHGGGHASPARRLALDALSERRFALWQDALVLLADHPLTGVGPGAFARHSPTALSDRDAVQAHHALLQLGAETGIPGLLLALALLVWAFAWLARGPLDTGTAVVAVALAAVGVHASVDYILHFPAVVLATATLIGAGRAPSVSAGARSGPIAAASGLGRPDH